MSHIEWITNIFIKFTQYLPNYILLLIIGYVLLYSYSSIDNDKNIYHCVFNKSHTMPYKTLAMHLAKCPDRPPNYKNCQFNNLHIVPASEFEVKYKIV